MDGRAAGKVADVLVKFHEAVIEDFDLVGRDLGGIGWRRYDFLNQWANCHGDIGETTAAQENLAKLPLTCAVNHELTDKRGFWIITAPGEDRELIGQMGTYE